MNGASAKPRPGTRLPEGLSSHEALLRFQRMGPNELAHREASGLMRTLSGVASEPMFVLLLVAAGVYLLIGDLGEGLLLSFFALVTIGLVIYQEQRSSRALQALAELAAPQARVMRDAQWCWIAAREVVPGDWLAVDEGQRVAADGVVRQGSELMIDESMLTGESAPVHKPSPAARPLTVTQVFAGTLVVSGHAFVEVTHTGERTRMGGIGASLAGIDVSRTPLQRQLQTVVQAFAWAALVASVLLWAWYAWQRDDALQGLLAAIALGMAMLPEEFPMALTVFLALGAWRLARLQVLVRRPAVVEALGAATVLCVDKTGTLTENRMRVQCLLTDVVGHTQELSSTSVALPQDANALLHWAALASRADGPDPMDRAIHALAIQRPDVARATPQGWHVHPEPSSTPRHRMVLRRWRDPQGRLHCAAKGAPEAVLQWCEASAQEAAQWMQRVHELAQQGLRVLGVAALSPAVGAGPQEAAPPRCLGLLAFEDPLRHSVPQAVALARTAGVRVIMITGDHPTTALAIARQAGLAQTQRAVRGQEFEALEAASLDEAVRTVDVYARMTPEHKLRLVELLKQQGHTVAMTGDGVNDAPALKAAHIGIAMGRRGTDVAREAAALVLLDEDFSRIVSGVRMGRRIFDNLRKVMNYITAIHLPIAGLALLPVVWGWPPLLLPVHVVLTEMVVDPMCSLAFEGAPESRELMQQPPRALNERLLSVRALLQGLTLGAVILVVTLLAFGVARHLGHSTDVARTLAVVGLTVGNLWLVVLSLTQGVGWRAWAEPGVRAFAAVAVITLLAVVLGIVWAPARTLLHFEIPPLEGLAVTALAVVGALSAAAWAMAALLPHPDRPHSPSA